MDEVKLKVYVPQDGAYGLVPQEGGSPVEEETCYLKSEVDKVIENLQLKYNVQFCAKVAKHHQLLHQKYKRCLAMARRCHEAWASISTPYQKAIWYHKWYEYWLKLAEEFKE